MIENKKILEQIKETWGCECLQPVDDDKLVGGNFEFRFVFCDKEVFLKTIKCYFLSKEYDITTAFDKLHPTIWYDNKVKARLEDLDLKVAHDGIRRCIGIEGMENPDFTIIPDEKILDKLRINMINVYVNSRCGSYYELFCRTDNHFEEGINKYRISDIDEYYNEIKEIIDSWYSLERNNTILNNNMLRLKKYSKEELRAMDGEQLFNLYKAWNYSINEYFNNLRNVMNIENWYYEAHEDNCISYAPKREFDKFLKDPVIEKLIEFWGVDFNNPISYFEAERIISKWSHDQYNPDPYPTIKNIRLIANSYVLDSNKLGHIWFTIFGTDDLIGKCIHVEPWF